MTVAEEELGEGREEGGKGGQGGRRLGRVRRHQRGRLEQAQLQSNKGRQREGAYDATIKSGLAAPCRVARQRRTVIHDTSECDTSLASASADCHVATLLRRGNVILPRHANRHVQKY